MYAIFQYEQTDINGLTFFNILLTKKIWTYEVKQISL